MSGRLTNCDIEVHMTDLTEGMPTDGLDVDASNTKARELVTAALLTAYPQYTVHVHVFRVYGGPVAGVAAYPDDVAPEDVLGVVYDALGEPEEGRWYVLTEEAPR